MCTRRSTINQWDTAWRKTEYLNDSDVRGFIRFVMQLEDSEGLNHRFEVSTPAWRKLLKERGTSDSVTIEPWLDKANRRHEDIHLRMKSLRDARQNYFWLTPAVADESEFNSNDETKAHDLNTNNKILVKLENAIQRALRNNDASKAFLEAIKILDWGKTYRGSIGWLVSKHEDGTLNQSILEAVSILDGDSWSVGNNFCVGKLRMDSGLTKVFSLASKSSAIYDSRVAAGLGLLIRLYLNHKERNEVPLPLRFVRSSIKKRDPSQGKLKFPLRPAQNPTPSHACSNLLANWVIEGLAKELRDDWNHRSVEASLFILGYAVN